MQVQKIFKAGNSKVVAIPPEIMAKVGLRLGDKVVVEPANASLVVRKVGIKVSKDKKTELKQWFKEFVKENGEILDELALRWYFWGLYSSPVSY